MKYFLNFFVFTCSSDGLDLHGVFAWLTAFLLQLYGELFQVCHSPLIGHDQILKIAGRKETYGCVRGKWEEKEMIFRLCSFIFLN